MRENSFHADRSPALACIVIGGSRSSLAITLTRDAGSLRSHADRFHRSRFQGAVTACCGLGDHTIAGRSNWRFLSASRRLLLGAGRERHPHRNNSEHGNQKQRRDRASHGTPPFTQGMDGITEGAARQCGFILPRTAIGSPPYRRPVASDRSRPRHRLALDWGPATLRRPHDQSQ